LLFMGGEIAQEREWSEDRELDWGELRWEQHRGVQDLVRTLNLLMVRHPALWQRDFDPSGFRWVDANDADQNVIGFVRFSADGADQVVCMANLSPVVRDGYRLGVPHGGPWVEALTTDAPVFGGSNVVNGALEAQDVPTHGLPCSVVLTLPPLGVVWLVSDGRA
jgi:1,4-alpha-glucan branching enzyme